MYAGIHTHYSNIKNNNIHQVIKEKPPRADDITSKQIMY